MLASRRTAPGDTGPDAAHFHQDESSFAGPWLSVPLPYLATSLCISHLPKELDLLFCSLSPYSEIGLRSSAMPPAPSLPSYPPPLHPLSTTKRFKKPGQESDPESRTAIVPENKQGGRGRLIRPNTSPGPQSSPRLGAGEGKDLGRLTAVPLLWYNQRKHLFPGRYAARGRRESRGTAGRTR